MKLRSGLGALSLLVAVTLSIPAKAKPVVLDRLVAVVDDTAIFRSELAARAEPFLKQVDAREADPKKRDALREQALREVLRSLIDERLEVRAAARIGITVGDQEVQMALGEVAKAASLTVPALFVEAKKQGLDEARYRAMLSFQILEAKVVQRLVQGKLSATATPAEAEAVRARAAGAWRDELRSKAFIDVRL